MIIEELNARDDFLLILAFRFLKYVKFTQEEKEVIFKSVLTHEFQAKRTFPMTLEELDQIILTKPDPTYRNVDEPKRIHELFPGPQAKIEKTKVLKLNTSDSEGEDDPKNKKKTANDSSDLSDSYEKERIESKLHKSIPIRTNFTLQKKDDELMDVEFYYKKKSVEDKTMVRKKYYPFINDKGEEFIFLQHGEGSCQFCPLASGLVNLNQKEFIKFCKKDLEKDEKISSYHDGDLPLAIFQSLFDFTLDEEISYIFQDLIPKLANSLISNTVPEKYKYPMLLYFTHLIVNVPGALQAIYGISFFIFSEEFIHDFLENFSINFMQKTRETMVKVMVPKKDQPKHDPKDKKKKQKVEVEMEEIEIPAKGMIFWDNERRSFIVKEAKLSEEYVAERKKYNTDELTDEGKFSKYFWRLHFIYHLFKMLLETIKKHSKTSKNVLLTQLEHFCTQVKDLTIIFQKYTEKYIPTSPFHEDTECWGDIRTLMFEIMALLQEIQFLLISRIHQFSNKFFKMFDENKEMLPSYIALLGKLPTLDSTVALTATLLIYYSFEPADILNMEQRVVERNRICKMIFENFAKECTRIRPALKGVLEANMKDLESVQIKNKKAFTNSMKLAMNGMSIINIMLSKFQIRPEDLDKYAANEIFHTFSVILKLANIQKIKSNLKQKNLSKNFIAEDYYLKKAIAGGFLQKTIEGDIQLVEQFMATAGLNLWLFNQTYGGALPPLQNGIYEFMLNTLVTMELPKNTLFGFFSGFHDMCYNLRNVPTVLLHYKNFPEDLGKFLKTYPDLDDILKLPLFRGLRLLIGTDTSNAKSFFDIVPILRNLCVDVPKYNQYDEDDEDNLMMDYMGQQKSNKGKPTFGDAFNEYMEEQREERIRQNPQSMEAILDAQLKMHHKILQKEIRKLMRSINVINHIDLQHELGQVKYPRKEAVQGAGMISETTKELIVAEKRRMEALKQQEEMRQKLKAEDYKTLTGNALLNKNKDTSASMPTLKRNLYAYQYPESLDMGVGSFTATRDLNRVIPKPYVVDDKTILREDRYVTNDVLGFSTESAFNELQYNNGTPVSRGNSMIKETAKNIVDLVDQEYKKILMEKDNKLKTGK